MPTKQQETTSGRCQAMTKAGGACAAPAIKGGQLCSLHSDPERAAELGRQFFCPTLLRVSLPKLFSW
jgi:hypothetical protein